jgi:chorismate mutase
MVVALVSRIPVLLLLFPSISAAAFIGSWGPQPPSRVALRATHMDTTTTTSDDNIKTVDVFSLDSIRSTLVRQEETIIFALIERAQFRTNKRTYESDGFGDLGYPLGSNAVIEGDNQQQRRLSFLEFMLIGTEVLHCGARRYMSPEEHAFFPERLPLHPMDQLPSLQYSKELLSSVGGANEINFNRALLNDYIDTIVPLITKKGDDEQHGSTALCDIAVLQALSRRVHYGKFVAESKYRSDPEEYQRLVDNNDAEGVMKLLTNAVVEEQVVRRARLKAATYGTFFLASLPPISANGDTKSIIAQAAASAVVAALEALDGYDKEESTHEKVNPAAIESIYRDIIIPMTKDIEVCYLFKRCGREPPREFCSSKSILLN